MTHYKYILTPLAVFPSVARGKVSAPQAVTPSYTREYTAVLLRDPSSTYLVLRSRDVPPAASPAISSGRCRHLSSGFRSLQALGHTGDRTGGNLKNVK
ncbi:unnamed protein product [Staurois parvus]|uniref:Uncharacterized protein n=1 Tax=Staurois parvus TaxID=386267 RepID=A0ABN9EFI3_9NEOB|nr:unnamed protein product [Staurois parvus]